MVVGIVFSPQLQAPFGGAPPWAPLHRSEASAHMCSAARRENEGIPRLGPQKMNTLHAGNSWVMRPCRRTFRVSLVTLRSHSWRSNVHRITCTDSDDRAWIAEQPNSCRSTCRSRSTSDYLSMPSAIPLLSCAFVHRAHLGGSGGGGAGGHDHTGGAAWLLLGVPQNHVRHGAVRRERIPNLLGGVGALLRHRRKKGAMLPTSSQISMRSRHWSCEGVSPWPANLGVPPVRALKE